MIAEHERRVLDLIDDQQQEVIDFLRNLLAFKTITPGGNAVDHDEFIRHQAYVKKTLEDSAARRRSRRVALEALPRERAICPRREVECHRGRRLRARESGSAGDRG
jgi:hypothetical protein